MDNDNNSKQSINIGCCVCGEGHELRNAHAWIEKEINSTLTNDLPPAYIMRIISYGFDFPTKLFCPKCFHTLKQIFR